MKHQTFDELLENNETTLTTLGLGYSARLETLCHAGMVIKRHESKGLTWFEEETISEYLQETENRFYEGKITKRKYNRIIFSTERLLHYLESGIIVPKKNSLKGSRCKIQPEFERIADAFLTSGVEITDVAQVLGDEKLDLTKKYISLDTNHQII